MATSTPISTDAVPEPHSLEEWMLRPPKSTEWVDGKLVYKHSIEWEDGQRVETGKMTLKHSRIQSNLSFYWRSYKDSSGQGGEVYTEVPCRTNKQGRSPDVAYLTSELLVQFGEPDVLPQSFPLCAEIVSPTDLAEQVIAKAQEYLQSGGKEVWLIFPENRWVIVVTPHQRLVFASGEVVHTQTVLEGFRVAVDELLTGK
jgi:Uma2 family endonuclease